MDELDLKTILERIRKKVNVKSDSAIARALGVSRQVLCGRKHRGAIPYAEIIALCRENGWSLDDIFLGIVRFEITPKPPRSFSRAEIARLIQDIANAVRDGRPVITFFAR